ncbi:MAG: hypothetical protein L0332_24090 [Chloroflexi bacterium]|nr:hypothetical protein [Chloroflexota bacterium]MCI0645176.1 hypothetical protein [Chloroflexota bacterium]MCI0729775.1 hypothetical protein [Chloroflexota bacterium]
MAEFRYGDMWTAYSKADLFLITTNSTIRQNGALVMGRGIACQARDRFPGLDKALGRQILNACGHLGEYGLLVSPRWPAAKLGAFQVKTRYDQPADPTIIEHSTAALHAWCAAHPTALVCLNFPGIGNGRLPREQVLPIVEQLPANVTIWEYQEYEPPAAAAKQTARQRPDWLPDPQDAEAMATAAEKFFALPELPMNEAERMSHIFAAAFYRGAAWMHGRLPAESRLATERFDGDRRGAWVQGEALFLEGVEDAALACQRYRELLAASQVAVSTGVSTDAMRLLLLQRQTRQGAAV